MKLDIINIDKLKSLKGSNRYRNKSKILPIHPYNMIINGGTNTGKTNLVMNIIYKFATFDKLWFYSKHLHQPKMVMLKEFFDKVEEKTEQQLLHTGSTIEEIVPVDDLDSSIQNLVVFDDFVLEKDFTPITNYYIRGRHSNCSCIFLSQAYTKIPRGIRINTHYYCFFKIPNRREVGILYGEVGYSLTKPEFIRRFKKATNDKYSFFFIDAKTKIPQLQFRRNFNEVEMGSSDDNAK